MSTKNEVSSSENEHDEQQERTHDHSHEDAEESSTSSANRRKLGGGPGIKKDKPRELKMPSGETSSDSQFTNPSAQGNSQQPQPPFQPQSQPQADPNVFVNQQQQQQQSPLGPHAAPYMPLPVASFPSMIPSTIPMNMPMPMNMPINMNMPMNMNNMNIPMGMNPMNIGMNVNVNVDPLLQVQFYEARMRDHAAAFAQYANAAAGAALAAAHMATSSCSATGASVTASASANANTNASGGSFHPSNFQNSMPFSYPHGNDMAGTEMENGVISGKTRRNASTRNGLLHSDAGSGTGTAIGTRSRNGTGADTPVPAVRGKGKGHAKKRSQHNTSLHNTSSGTTRNVPADYPQHHQSNRRTRRRRDHDANNIASSAGGGSGVSSGGSRQNYNHGKKTKRFSIKSFDLMGKTGVSALHDLCNKKRWSQPKFSQITMDSVNSEDSHGHGQASTCTSSSIHVEFIMSVEVNGVELSRGRGGSKKSAQQDASRKALSVLYPGCCFDANGILLDLGKMDDSAIVFESVPYDSRNRNNPSDCLEDLEANMASRLSIDGNVTNGRLSPDPSEDSSISTTVSMAKGKPAPLVTGGPFIHVKDRARNRLAFPSASTTSGVSSASEDVDDDEYLASRGASVCSALLNVMVQIDKRIKEQPIYTFDVCANPATIAQQQQQEEMNANLGRRKSRMKRKGEGFSGVGGAIVSKRRGATNAVGRLVTIHRSSFACTASLTLYGEKIKSHPINSKCLTFKDEQVPTFEDENVNNISDAVSCDLEARKDKIEGSEEDRKRDSRPVDNLHRNTSAELADESSVERLQAVGTGANKREARHIASAKLLAMLFPDCNGMVEVKAAAEAAREQYAANRARLKRAAQSDGGKFTKRERRRKLKNETHIVHDNLCVAYPHQDDPPIPNWFSSRLLPNADKDVSNRVDSSPSSDGMAKLSLSESAGLLDAVERPIKDPSKSDSTLQVSRQRQFEDKIDSALQLLQENDDDKKPSRSSFEDNELSKTILRRATIEDVESLERLLSDDDEEKKRISIFQNQESPLSSINPLSLVGVSTLASQLWGSQSVVLILSRAIASQDEPPLGCAVLSLGFSLEKGRLLRISEIRNEIHFPKERLIECLEDLGNKMDCTVEVRDHKKEMSNGIFFTAESLQEVVSRHVKKDDTDTESNSKHTSSIYRKPLQSVKEEDDEDDDVKSDHLNHKRAKLI